MMEENDDQLELTDELKAILDERLLAEENTYLTLEESMNYLNEKYGM